jgi:ATP-dependent Clp protease ATP-binding subunit ClpA
VRLLSRERSKRLHAERTRPAERYLTAGAEEARRLGCRFVGTEHVLLALVRDQTGGIAPVLERLGVGVAPAAIVSALEPWLAVGPGRTKIDPEALALLGIDFEAVRARIEETFGPGALEHTSASCLGIAPRLKLALAHALDFAGESPLSDEHVVRGMLSVPDSGAARALATLGLSTDSMQPPASPG